MFSRMGAAAVPEFLEVHRPLDRGEILVLNSHDADDQPRLRIGVSERVFGPLRIERLSRAFEFPSP